MGTFEDLVTRQPNTTPSQDVAIEGGQSPVTVATQPPIIGETKVSQFSDPPEVKALVGEETEEEDGVHTVTKGDHIAKIKEELNSGYTHLVQCVCHWTGRFRSHEEAKAAAQRHVDVRASLADKNK